MKVIEAPKLLDKLSLVIAINNMTLWPVVITRDMGRFKISERTQTHEGIHLVQQQEFFYLGLALGALWMMILALQGTFWFLPLLLSLLFWPVAWLVLYVGFWLIARTQLQKNITVPNPGYLAYHLIPFEQEAYVHDGDPTYLDRRIPFAWIRFLFSMGPPINPSK